MTVLAQQEPPCNSLQEKSERDAGIIAEWPLKQHERLRVSIEHYKGAWLINVRKWYEAESGELQPGRHGIALAVKNLPRLAAALSEAVSVAREHGLIPADQESAL